MRFLTKNPHVFASGIKLAGLRQSQHRANQKRAVGADHGVKMLGEVQVFFTDLHNHWLNVTLLRKPFSLVELTETIGGMLCAAHNVGWGQKEHNELFQNKNANQIF